MKRLSAVLLVGAMCLVAISCGGGGNTPSAVTKAYYAAIQKNDMDGIAKYATQETVDFAKSGGGVLARAILAEMGTIEIVSEKIDGDEAVVTAKFENESDPMDLTLVRQNGKWLVHDVPSGK